MIYSPYLGFPPVNEKPWVMVTSGKNKPALYNAVLLFFQKRKILFLDYNTLPLKVYTNIIPVNINEPKHHFIFLHQ